MADAPLAIVVTTHPQEGADALARTLVERRIAACVQVAPVRSTYWWNGAIETADEVRLECKTAVDRIDACVAAIRELHPYEVPEILVVHVDQAGASYAAWARSITRS